MKKFLRFLLAIAFVFITFASPTPTYAAGIVVNTNADNVTEDGLCTLREAITTANSDTAINAGGAGPDCTTGSGADIITIGSSYLITLGSQLPSITSEITIDASSSLIEPTIQASTCNPITLPGGCTPASYRVLFVSSTGNLTLNHIIVQHGNCLCLGAGISNNGTVTVTNSAISNNTGEGGDGIYNSFILTVTNSTISGNSSEGHGGGIYNQNPATMTVSNSTISNNSSGDNGGGIYSNGGAVTVSNSTISNNSSGVNGGGIYNNGTTMTVTNSAISNNTGDTGGGIYNNSITTMTVTNSIISYNTGVTGGGISNMGFGSLQVTNNTFSNNTSITGGGIYNDGTLTVTNNTFFANSASFGGGIANVDTLTVTNSTFSVNSATDGGGISNDGALTVNNSTFSANSANTEGGGIYTYASDTTTLYNTVVANSPSGSDCVNYGTLIANSFNIDSDGTCDGATERTTLEINLQALANNGGATQTMALGSGSLAIDAGDNTACDDTSPGPNNLDQRGATRPQGTTCDIGAYEKLDASGFPTFVDVQTNGFAWAQIESIFEAGITGGCSTIPKNYCPSGTVTRAQMAVFLMKGMNGSSYTPPAATGTVFNDVAINSFAAAYIEAFSAEGITGGCGGGNFCPSGLVTRAQMAVFLLKAKHGSGYTSPAATGTMFNDVAINSFAAAWIEQLATEGITGGCGGGNYCPNNAVSRAQMAVFLQKTFNLPLP